MDVVQHLKSEVEDLYGLIKKSRKVTQDHKFSAHERLFKIILNLSTLALTAWVVIVAWNFEPFKTQKDNVLVSCNLFIASLLLVSLGDISIMLQSFFVDQLVNKYSVGVRKISSQISYLILQHTELKAISSQELLKQGTDFLHDEAKSLVESHKILPKLGHATVGGSWLFGMAGVLVFFVAIVNGIDKMTTYVTAAQEVTRPAVTDSKGPPSLKEK
jgi:hypothetical protein